jgi:Pentapeptide repeats (8 copies)
MLRDAGSLDRPAGRRRAVQLVTTLIYVSIGLLIVVVLFGYVLDMGWVGVRGIKQEGGTSYKTLWDWMDLLIVPTVLALGGLLLSQAQEVRQQELLDQRDDDIRVQGYLDQMSQFLLDEEDPLRASQRGSDVRTVARARTLTVLRGLDPEDKRSVVRFLDESGLIQKSDPEKPKTEEFPIVRLDGANLSYANLSNLNLSEADLSQTDLTGADLSEVRLADAELSDANLTGANGVTKTSLEQATESLTGTTMPNGAEHP